ncbi:DUF6525 family protein [Vannielia sp.]|uniref:DUF6525 family protein n=1 Tax=Vannielia sp. TaxID=2813045 RepID=UPI0026306E2C|nr:DUF6525 family protein [Vannielia sp.]MDF1873771.1 DUF6525 family protein [Vannielia sp.]
MGRNLGATSLPRKRRPHDPMRSYDALPAPLRAWLAKAALPWSPASARRLWKRAKAEGHDTQAALQLLSRAEERTLARDHHSLKL